jgi:FG-GAP-like repeat/FG-GAP repeat
MRLDRRFDLDKPCLRSTTPPRRRRCKLSFEPRVSGLEARVLLSSTPAMATTLPLNSLTPGYLARFGSSFYRVSSSDGGELTVSLQTSGPSFRVSLVDALGSPLVQSDAPSSDGNSFRVNVLAGDDLIEVQSLGDAGSFQINAQLTVAVPGLQPILVNFNGNPTESLADMEGNGTVDLVTADGIRRGLGDGTFQTNPVGGPFVDPGWTAYALTVVEFGHDALPDLAVAEVSPDGNSGALRLLRNVGNDQFVPDGEFLLGTSPLTIEALNFGDGVVDLAVADSGTGAVQIFVGNADGRFTTGPVLPAGASPVAMTTGTFGNGGVEIVISDLGGGPTLAGPGLTVIQADAPDQFHVLTAIPLGWSPLGLTAGDFNGDGQDDLAVTDTTDNAVWIMEGNGDGTFQAVGSYPVGQDPDAVTATSLSDDGALDLIVANANSNDVSVLLGNGDGTFQTQQRYGVGNGPVSLAVADLNNDDRPDVVVANGQDGSVSVLLGRGDGTFQDTLANPVGDGPQSAVAFDFNRDGHEDLVTADANSDDISVLLGNGDGTFQPAQIFAAGVFPVGVVEGDFNGDGRPDLAVVDAGVDGDGGGISILLGNGDGTFQNAIYDPTVSGSAPRAIVAGDFLGNGVLDLAVADSGTNDVTIFLGDGRGHFAPLAPVPLGDGASEPVAIAAGDFGNGRIDLAVANKGSNDVTILSNLGNGNFQALPTPIPLPGNQGSDSPIGIVTGDFTGDGTIELAVAQKSTDLESNVTILQQHGNGQFDDLVSIPLSSSPSLTSIVAAPFFGTGPLGLAVAGANGNGLTFLKSLGGGAFQIDQGPDLGAGGSPETLAGGTFDGSGRADVAVAREGPNGVTVQLNEGNGTFVNAGAVGLVPRNTPVVGDLSGDGVADVAVVDGSGNILYRQGIVNEPGNFESPITINPGAPARDIARVVTARGVMLAAVDATDNALTLYQDLKGQFVRVGTLPTGSMPAQVVAADLSGDGSDDLIVRNAEGGTLTLLPSNGQGWFLPPVTLAVGAGVSNVSVADLNDDGRPDIVLSNQSSGSVEVLENQPDGEFSAPTLYRAGAAPATVSPGDGDSPLALTSLDGTIGAVALALTAGDPLDLVAVNSGSETLGVLQGLGAGQFANATTLPMNGPALAVQSIEIDGSPGLAVLGPNGVTIWQLDGAGQLIPSAPFNAGPDPTGLTVADVDGDGVSDLVGGNASGDVLVLLGLGNGDFQAPVMTDQGASLAVVKLHANGPATLIKADQALDQVVVQNGAVSAATILADRSTGLIAPSAVVTADLNGDGIPDLIFANSGGDDVFVYPGLPGGGYGPGLNNGQGFFTGTNPVAITVADLSGNGRPDLIVANKGSNDVTILRNESTSTGFTFVSGPRLRVGSGPVSVAYANVGAKGTPALVVSDSISRDVMILPSLGNGFFNDTTPTILSLMNAPGPLFVGPFGVGSGLDVVTLNPDTGHVTVLSNLSSGRPDFETVSTGGFDPVAALAVNGLNGFEDLVIANRGDDTVSLMEGSSLGLLLTTSIRPLGLSNPSALAFGSLGDDTLEVYAAGAGTEGVALMTFTLGGVGVAATPSAAALVLTPSAAASLTLLPLAENSLPLVGSLLTPLVEPGASAGENQVSDVIASMTAALSYGQGPYFVPTVARGFDHDDSATSEASENDATPDSAPVSAWAREVFGLDAAFADFRKRARANNLFNESNATPQRANPEKQSQAPTHHGPDAAVDEALDALMAEANHDPENSHDGIAPATPAPTWRPSPRLAALLTALVLLPAVPEVPFSTTARRTTQVRFNDRRREST